jgi:hypothetical protein
MFREDIMAGYKPYKLDSLKNYILKDLGKAHFTDGANSNS